MKIDVYTSKLLNHRFSKVALLAFALAFASIGTYIVFTSLAATNFTVTPTATSSLVTPEVNYPPDGSILIAKRPQLVWKAVSGANSYRVKVYQDDNLVIDDVAKTTSYTPFFDLTDKGNYYWSVQALYANIALDTSPVYQLAARKVKTPAAPPVAPILVSPATGTHFSGTSVTVLWNKVIGATTPISYVAQYSGSATFAADGSFVSPWYTTPALTANSVPFLELTPNTYYWHVKTVDGQGRSSAWSATRSYIVDASPVVTPPTAPTTPTPPPPTVSDTNVTISNMSTPTYLYNFSIDSTKTADFLMPSPSKKWVGAYVPGTASDFTAFETMTAKKHDVALKFRSFYWDAAFPVAEAKGFYDKGLQYVVTWEPWDPSKGISQPQFSNTAITTNQSFTSSTGSSVKFDDYIGSWATSIKNYKKPVYVRFAHEMNGNWYPWGNGNSNTSASYVAMWKHVHDIFEQKGVKNVRWIWCVNNDPSNTVASYYPGNSYVDVSAIDGYNWGNTRTWSSWTDFRYVISNAYNAVTSVSNKPVWVAETASAESGGAKSTWITNAFASKTLFPKLNTIIWFNTNKETDWRVNSSTGALNSYKAAVPTF